MSKRCSREARRPQKFTLSFELQGRRRQTPAANPAAGTAPAHGCVRPIFHRRPTAWSWSFGDGTSSTERNPTHTYTAAGTYTVTLTVTSAAGSMTKTGYIVVRAPPPPEEQKVSEETYSLRSDAVNVSTGDDGRQQVTFNATAGTGEIGNDNKTIHIQTRDLNIAIETDGLADDGTGTVVGVSLASSAPVNATVGTGNVSVSFAARMPDYNPIPGDIDLRGAG